MSGQSPTCPKCSEAISADDQFCPHCGGRVEVPAAPAAAGGLPPKKAKVPMKTMVAFNTAQAGGPPAAAQPAAAQPAAAPAAAKKPQMKTMMGLSPDDMQKVQAAVEKANAQEGGAAAPAAAAKPAPVAEPAAKPAAKPAANPAAGNKATMLGISAADLADRPLPTPSKRPAPGREPSPEALGRTIPSTAPPPAEPGAAPAEVPKAAPVPAVGGGRTMLGAPGVGMQLPTPVRKPLPSGAPGGGRTMIGGPSAAAAVAGLPGAPAPQPGVDPGAGAAQAGHSAYPSPEDADGMSVPGVGGAAGRRLGMVLAAAGVLLGLLAGVLLLRGGGAPAARAKVVSIDSGEAILFEVPEAAAGTKIQFGEQTKLLKAGSATFPLGADALKVGDNVVLAKVLDGDGDGQEVRITLAVEYRIHVDTGPLEAGKAEVDVVISALPGTVVQLDGEDLKLDAEGRAVQPYPLDLDAAKGGVLEHRVKYRVQPPSGEAVVDELLTRVRVTSLQLDSPGASLVTDAASVEIAGAVDKGTKVQVDGKPVPVASGRFLTSYPLPKAGKYAPVVEAQSPGRAPHRLTLDIERVDDLVAAAAAYQVNADIDYAKLSQNAAMYKGQRVAFEGRVFHVMVEGQKAALQMLVRDCPNNCSLWADYPAGLEVKKGAWVRVLGTVEGVQQFRSAKNEVASVPKLQAAFVVPVTP